MPKVSVITPLYNGEDHIEACIDSVDNQTDRDLEHIIVNNNSTDNGPAIVRRLQETRPWIIFIDEPEKGAGPARNAAISIAQGRYVAFLDADDAWKPEKVEQQIGEMEKIGAGFSWTAYDIFKDGTFIRIQDALPRMSYDTLLSKRATIGCLTAIYDTHAFGKRYMNSLPMRQDFCLWLDLLKIAEAENIPCCGLNRSLAIYNAHSKGMTSDKKKAALMQWKAYRTHVGLSRFQSAMKFVSYAFHAIKVRALRK